MNPNLSIYFPKKFSNGPGAKCHPYWNGTLHKQNRKEIGKSLGMGFEWLEPLKEP
jgi:hypothetical protein